MRQLSNLLACRSFCFTGSIWRREGVLGAGGAAGNGSPPCSRLWQSFFFVCVCGFQVHPFGEVEKFYAAPKAQKPLFINSLWEEACFGVWICGSWGRRGSVLNSMAFEQLVCPASAPVPNLWNGEQSLSSCFLIPKHLRRQLSAEAMGIADLFRQRGIRKLQSPRHRLDDLQAIRSQQIRFGWQIFWL